MHSLDISLFYSLYGLSGHSGHLDGVIVFVGEYLGYLLVLAVALFAWREVRQKRWNKVWGYIVAVLGAIIARLVVTELIRSFYHHLRPSLALHITPLWSETTYSFPSGHTIFFFALAAGVYRINKPFGWTLYVLSFLIGVARVAGGVHYPLDILGGIVLGILTSIAVIWIWKSIGRNIALPSI
jgi:undecaprenyl-diphosphatase